MYLDQKKKNLLWCIGTAVAAMVLEAKTGTASKIMAKIKG